MSAASSSACSYSSSLCSYSSSSPCSYSSSSLSSSYFEVLRKLLPPHCAVAKVSPLLLPLRPESSGNCACPLATTLSHIVHLHSVHSVHLHTTVHTLRYTTRTEYLKRDSEIWQKTLLYLYLVGCLPLCPTLALGLRDFHSILSFHPDAYFFKYSLRKNPVRTSRDRETEI